MCGNEGLYDGSGNGEEETDVTEKELMGPNWLLKIKKKEIPFLDNNKVKNIRNK